VPASEKKVKVVVKRLFLHVPVVYRSVPCQEGKNADDRDIHDAGDEILHTVVRALSENEDAGDHVDDEGAGENEPELEEAGDERLGR